MNESHQINVLKLVKNQPEVMQKLLEEYPDTRKNGRGHLRPPYATGTHRTYFNVSGANITLLNEIVRSKIEQLDHEPKRNEITKSGVLNEIIEQWFAANKDKI